MMPAGHHSDSDSTILPLPKSAITWFGGIFARLPPANHDANNVSHFGCDPVNQLNLKKKLYWFMCVCPKTCSHIARRMMNG